MTSWINRRMIARLGILGLLALGLPARPASAADQPLAGKTFTVGIHNRTPWGYRDKDGNVVGYHPDVVRAALEPLGAKFDFVVADFGALIPGLLANRFDMIASGVAITPARCQQVLFGEPDLAAGDGLLVVKGNPKKLHSYADFAKNADAKLGGGRGTENAKNALAAGVPESQMAYFPNNEAIVSAILAGRIDAGTLSAPSVAGVVADANIQGIERALPFEGLKKPDGRPAQMYTGTVFRKDETQLRELYNAQLAKLKQDGMLQKLMERYGFSSAEAPPAITSAEVCAGND